MASQNLVSVVLTEEKNTSINSHLAGLKADLDFTVQLEPEEKQDYFKVGNAMLPFIDLAYRVVSDHPEILPGIFDKDEFEKDYQLAKALSPINANLNEITKAVDNTYFAAASDAMAAALEVYAAARQNQDKIAGLDVTASSMGEFFKKTKKKTAQI